MKYMNAEDFRNEGFLQEVNRQFFHPLGLALALDVDSGIDDEGYMKVQVWDERGDPEGWFFGKGEIDSVKAFNVESLRLSKAALRNNLLNHVFTPSPVQGVKEIPNDRH
jgi:hypothetical protein